MEIYFATSNIHKFNEANEIIPGIKRFSFKHNEIRSDNLEEIAVEAVKTAYAKLKKPVFVDDTGLSIDALNGFPGAYSAWVMEKIGPKGILKLLKGIESRGAHFETYIAFHDGNEVKTFAGKCNGNVGFEEKGKDGFGYDSLFIPKGENQTFAESKDLKNKLSHRYLSLLKLSKYIKENFNKK
ncbi:MAG: RdgB/HAM1 family non-canonical purine NTP pyrophosphatase [Candidatus Micrarchaeota archaeon]